MKDFSLSLLSRGCGRLVSSNGNTGRHDGRLDVCFTPQDYFIWKSRDSLLRLSNSGRQIVNEESALPKTYSTRRGQLQLYSQDLVTIETSAVTRDGKQKVVRRYTQQDKSRLSTLKELTAAILSYSNTQYTSSRLGPLFLPPLHRPLAPDLHHPIPPPLCTTQVQPSPELLGQFKPERLPAEGITEFLGNQPEGKRGIDRHIVKEEGQGIRKTVRLDLFLQIPCRDRTPTSQVQPPPAMTPEELEEPLTYLDMSRTRQHAGRSQHSTGGERHHSNMKWVHDMADDIGSIQDSLKTHDEGNYERSIRGSRHEGLLPPLTVGQTASHRPCLENTARPKWEGARTDEHHTAHCLPPIAESRTVNILHQQPRFLPLLFPEKEDPPLPPPPVAGSIAGRKGPGKQSSLAFLQNRQLDLQNPCKSRDPSRGVVRGILPLELRDLQNGKPVGSLILGPDGEIIQLSLYNDNHDHDTQEQALQVLSAEGEKLPLVIVLQTEKTHTGGELEPDGDIQHHQAIHKLVEFHTLTEINACSPSSQDPGKTAVSAVTETKTKTSEAVAWKKVIKNHITIPPLKEQVGKEAPRAGNTEQGSIHGSHQPGKQNINPNEATTELTGDKRRTKTKRKDAEEAATTREMKPGKTEASDGQKTLRARTEGGWQRQKTKSDAESIRRRTEEERTNSEEADTQHHSALPSVRKRMPDKGGGRGEEKTNEKKKERGEVARQKDESAVRRKRRGRLKDKELAEINEEPMKKEEEEINQNIKKASHLKSTERPSATQRHNNQTHLEEEKEHVNINADKHSQSESSLRSTASPFSPKSLKRSSASFCEGVERASATGLAPSRGCLSSCSTVMITEEKLMLNPIKQESSRPRNGLEEAAALRLAKRAERRRQDVERKRREREEEDLKQQKREETEERMKSELEQERRKRAEELRRRKLAEEEERRKHEEEEQERVKREQAQREREKRRQEERRRQMERLQRMREEDEQRREAELERLRLEEKRQQEEERKKLLEMEESERIDYLCRKEQEEESRRDEEEQRKRREEEATLQAAEEARLQAEQLAREMALLQQQLAVKRRLLLEAGGLEKTQGISRPWIYSYFTLLQLLGVNPTTAETITPDL
ncbi:uncharacterized protein KIAA2012 [Trematomus bernacchii]|uniref:uncharacterized protein KIAA2012 n=1 Tax=Trematomus bernacchii TaxID=40690 RepID=UPI00146DB163|nr:uncharacterized protein KIAA2012 [Trematomus bernacchii]